MICGYCGAENEDGSMFCAVCGKKIGEEAVSHEEVAAEHIIDKLPEPEQLEENEPAVPSEEKKEPKKIKLPVIICAVAVVCILLAVFLVNKAGIGISIGKSGKSVNTPLWACIDSQDTAYIQFANGNHIKIDDVKEAAVTPDRKWVVVLDTTDELYITDPGVENKTRIAEKVKRFNIHDNVISYSTEEEWYIYRYAANETIRLSKEEISASYVSAKGGNFLYGGDDSVYILTKTMKEPEKIGKYDTGWKPLYISDDGSIAYWAVIQEDDYSGDENTYEIYSYMGGERNKVCTFDASFYPNLMFNESGSYGILALHDKESLFIIDKKGTAMKVGFGNPLNLYRGNIYTDKISFYDDRSSSFPGMYFAVRANDDKTSNLYYVDKNGEREKVISGISDDWCIHDGYLYYVIDDELRYARLDRAVLKNDERITSDIDKWLIGNDGYIYFIKDYDEDKNGYEFGTVYVTKSGKEAVKISSDVWLKDFYSSDDGKTLYFYKDPNKNHDSATLYKYSYGKSAPERISDSVLLSGLSDGTGGSLDSTFTYYRQIDEQDYQWMYYDGKNSIKMVEGLRFYDLNL